MKKYHAHVYFDEHNRSLAEHIFSRAERCQHIFRAIKIYHHPVGPHPRPMFELQFSEGTKVQTEQWLEDHIGPLSALIHEDSGDDLRDHTEGFIWMGEKLPLNFSFFELIQRDPSLVVHKN